MATAEEIRDLRALISEPDDSNGWTDEKLGALIDSLLTVNASASRIWSVKAAEFSTLVDVAESGSSRKLGDLYKNAKAMAEYFKGLDDQQVEVVEDVPVISRIRRGFT